MLTVRSVAVAAAGLAYGYRPLLLSRIASDTVWNLICIYNQFSLTLHERFLLRHSSLSSNAKSETQVLCLRTELVENVPRQVLALN